MSLAPLVVFLMLAVLAAVAVFHAARVRTGDDFALAGRGLGPGVLVGTLVATWIGTGSIFGNAEFTFETGVAAFLLPLPGLAGMLLLARIAPRLRRFGVTTVPEVLGRSFGLGARRLGAVALVGAYLIIVSYQYRAGAAVAERLFAGPDGPRALEVVVFGAELSLWPALFAFFVILYTALAGLFSVAWTDLVAGLVILVGVLASVAYLGLGWDPDLAALPEALLRPGGGLTAFGWVNVLLPSFLLILGDANLMQRFLAAESPAAARRSALGAFAGLLVIESAVIALALLGRAYLGGDLANPAHVIIDTAFTLVPPVLGLGLVAAIVAVVLSTADSYLLASSTSAATDLLPGRPSAGRHRSLVLLLGLVALGLAYTSDSFFRIALYAYTLYGVTITPALLAALLLPRTPRQAVVGGMLAGLGTALAWKLVVPGLRASRLEAGGDGALPAWLDLDPVLPALAANVLVAVLLALAFRSRRKEPPGGLQA
ncbi:MAG: sodium:solute symporter family protein [Planctomycetota bacterium]|nr:sodium:solute symporter family protein [Planctomycetota bacterium]